MCDVSRGLVITGIDVTYERQICFIQSTEASCSFNVLYRFLIIIEFRWVFRLCDKHIVGIKTHIPGTYRGTPDLFQLNIDNDGEYIDMFSENRLVKYIGLVQLSSRIYIRSRNATENSKIIRSLLVAFTIR